MPNAPKTTPTDYRLYCMECSVTFYSGHRATKCPACGSGDLADALPASWDEDMDDE
jgi:hypothetical protein